MAASASSPCGACRFLRRKCVNGCIFAPYFHYEQAAAHFSAVHKVFGASNASKLLAHLPVTHRWEAAVTISYEALARLQDPIYGCVSHIFALQQQVLNLQVQLAHLREQAAAQILLLNSYATRNPSDELLYQKPSQDFQTWLPTENLPSPMPEFDEPPAMPYVEMSFSADDSNLMGGYAGDFCLEEIIARSISSSFDVQINDEL